ncbi:hypothetical protein HQ447_20575, partial [bacterium]|nr:hypothetical protein [bacterium]
MKIYKIISSFLPAVLMATALHAAEVHPEQAAINKTAAAFVDAFHKG